MSRFYPEPFSFGTGAAASGADEIVIVDTGSSDRTREIAGKYTSRVYEFPWCGDFSAARNYGFERATKEYCMWVDADDVMRREDRRRFLEMKKRLPADTDVVLLPYETGFDSEGRPVFSYYRERIVRNSPEFRFAGRVHETIPLKGTLRYEEIPVVHRKEGPGDPDRNLGIYEEMERAGVTLDVSHLNDESLEDVLARSRRPLVASHSNARAVCDHPRNLTDRQFLEIRDRGGLVGLNFCPAFLAKEPGQVGFDEVAAHIEHWLDLGGEDVVALGSDYDGTDVPPFLDGAATMPAFQRLLTDRFGEDLCARICAGNALAFFARQG